MYGQTNPVNKTMTVGELMEMLKDHDLETPVLIGTDYGDISHTLQLLSLDSDQCEIESQGKIEDSGYSRSGFALNEEESDEWDGERDEDDECEFCGAGFDEDCECNGHGDVLVIKV